MENKLEQRKRKPSADARIVQVVRKLKSTLQKKSLIEVHKNQEEVKNQKHITNIPIYRNINNQKNIIKKNSVTILKPIIIKKIH